MTFLITIAVKGAYYYDCTYQVAHSQHPEEPDSDREKEILRRRAVLAFTPTSLPSQGREKSVLSLSSPF